MLLRVLCELENSESGCDLVEQLAVKVRGTWLDIANGQYSTHFSFTKGCGENYFKSLRLVLYL